MIKGVDDGKSNVKRVVKGTVSIGEFGTRTKKTGEQYSAPVMLDHFTINKPVGDLRKNTFEYAPDAELMNHYKRKYPQYCDENGNLIALPILLINHDVDKTFQTGRAFFKKSHCFCYCSDGETYHRNDNNTRTKGTCTGEECCYHQSGNCKYTGDLYFYLEDHCQIGNVYRFHTSGRNSIVNIRQTLVDLIDDIKSFTRGIIDNVPLRLLKFKLTVTQNEKLTSHGFKKVFSIVNIELNEKDPAFFQIITTIQDKFNQIKKLADGNGGSANSSGGSAAPNTLLLENTDSNSIPDNLLEIDGKNIEINEDKDTKICELANEFHYDNLLHDRILEYAKKVSDSKYETVKKFFEKNPIKTINTEDLHTALVKAYNHSRLIEHLDKKANGSIMVKQKDELVILEVVKAKSLDNLNINQIAAALDLFGLRYIKELPEDVLKPDFPINHSISTNAACSGQAVLAADFSTIEDDIDDALEG